MLPLNQNIAHMLFLASRSRPRLRSVADESQQGGAILPSYRRYHFNLLVFNFKASRWCAITLFGCLHNGYAAAIFKLLKNILPSDLQGGKQTEASKMEGLTTVARMLLGIKTMSQHDIKSAL